MTMFVTIELQLLGLLGLMIHYGKAYATAVQKSEVYDLKKALPMAILSAVTTAALIYIREDIREFYPITRVSAIVLGYLGNSVMFSLIDTKKPKQPESELPYTPPNNN